MTESQTVLHVLPHPGGGGETYVDALERMEGYRFTRVFLAPDARPAGHASVVRRAFEVQRGARAYDLVHVHGEVAASLCLPAIARSPSVVTLHGLHLLRRAGGAKRLAARMSLRLVVRASTRTICVSKAEQVDVLDVTGVGSQKRLVVIHNGVDLLIPPSVEERSSTREELGLDPGSVVGVYLGSLDRHKGPLVAIRAALDAARDGPIVLLVAGAGPLSTECERIAAESRGAIRLLGHRSDVRRVLGAADFYVLPSEREGLSFSLLEAMSLGLAPVVSDAPGNPEAVGDAGIVVHRGDIKEFATAFRQLAGDDKGRRSVGEQASARVARHFTAERMIRRTREVYDEIGRGAGPTNRLIARESFMEPR